MGYYTGLAVPAVFELAKGLSQTHPDQARAALEKIQILTDDAAIRQQIPKVLRGIGYGLDESAVETVTKRWLFKPATLNGQPVSVQAKIEVTFRQF